jgi:hypothetical protein
MDVLKCFSLHLIPSVVKFSNQRVLHCWRNVEFFAMFIYFKLIYEILAPAYIILV